MSAEATGWVYRYSPYNGATFSVHHAIADSVNDQHQNEFWMAQGRLAKKARVGRASAQRALDLLVAEGFVELLEEGKTAGQANRYRFLFPELPTVYDSRGGVPHHDAPQAGGGASPRGTNPKRTQEGTQEDSSPDGEEKGESTSRARESEGQDPLERLVSHFADLCRRDGTTALLTHRRAVRSNAKQLLEAGVGEDVIREGLAQVVRQGRPETLARAVSGLQRRDKARAGQQPVPEDSAVVHELQRLRGNANVEQRSSGRSLGDVLGPLLQAYEEG